MWSHHNKRMLVMSRTERKADSSLLPIKIEIWKKYRRVLEIFSSAYKQRLLKSFGMLSQVILLAFSKAVDGYYLYLTLPV